LACMQDLKARACPRSVKRGGSSACEARRVTKSCLENLYIIFSHVKINLMRKRYKILLFSIGSSLIVLLSVMAGYYAGYSRNAALILGNPNGQKGLNIRIETPSPTATPISSPENDVTTDVTPNPSSPAESALPQLPITSISSCVNQLSEAWNSWKLGDVIDAENKAASIVGSPDCLPEKNEANHLLFLVNIVQGKFQAGIDKFSLIQSSYDKYSSLIEPLVETYRHLDMFNQASEYASKLNDPRYKALASLLSDQTLNPIKIDAPSTNTVSFIRSNLGAFMPNINLTINGKQVSSFLDTGGDYLFLSKRLANELGVTYGDRCWDDTNGPNTKRYCWGSLIKELKFGQNISIKNYPVVVTYLLNGEDSDLPGPVFGNDLLRRFYTTVDYPNRRFIFTPKHDSTLKTKHLGMLPNQKIEMPFYLSDSLFMVVRGSFGKQNKLNYFVDTGLPPLVPHLTKQPAVFADKDKLIAWGYNPDSYPHYCSNSGGNSLCEFNPRTNITIGQLSQKGNEVRSTNAPLFSGSGYDHFWGMKVDGIISHAFISKYAWTIDTTNVPYKYIFSK